MLVAHTNFGHSGNVFWDAVFFLVRSQWLAGMLSSEGSRRVSEDALASLTNT